MANINVLYNEYGLDGIIPYIADSDKNAYNLVIEKLKDTPFYILFSSLTDFPKITVENGTYYAHVYTREDMMAPLREGDFNEFSLLKAFGVDKVRINDMAEIKIDDLTDVKIENRKLTGSLFVLLDNPGDKAMLDEITGRVINTNELYVCCHNDGEDKISSFILDEGESIYAFTNKRLFEVFKNQNQYDVDFFCRPYSGLKLRSISLEYDMKFMVNPGTIGLIIGNKEDLNVIDDLTYNF